jgi:NADPH2:quinone reductase
MRALCVRAFGGLDQLVVEDLPAPEPGPGELRLRVQAAGVNFADILMIAGKYQLRPDLPFAPGFEVAGVVDDLGPETAGPPTGTRVVGTPWYGGFAEQVVLPASGVFLLPEHIDAVAAVSSTVIFGTAYHALVDRGRLEAGDTLLVTGATGGVGSAAVQVGKALGATVIAAVGSPAKVQAALDLGADHVLRYDEEADPLRAQVNDLTAGKGVDLILDPVGGDVFDHCIRALAPNGTLLVIGFAAGRIPSLATNLVLLKETSVAGVFWGAFRDREPEVAARQLDTVWRWMADGKLAPVPTSERPLEEGAAALEDIAARRVIGKAVLLPGGAKGESEAGA